MLDKAAERERRMNSVFKRLNTAVLTAEKNNLVFTRLNKSLSDKIVDQNKTIIQMQRKLTEQQHINSTLQIMVSESQQAVIALNHTQELLEDKFNKYVIYTCIPISLIAISLIIFK